MALKRCVIHGGAGADGARRLLVRGPRSGPMAKMRPRDVSSGMSCVMFPSSGAAVIILTVAACRDAPPRRG